MAVTTCTAARDMRANNARQSNSIQVINSTRDAARANSQPLQTVTHARLVWRRKRVKRTRLWMLITLVVVCLGVMLISVKLAQLTTLNRRIQLTQSANRAVEARVDNLRSEMLLETRSDIVRQKAMAQLSMVMPPESEARAILLTRAKDSPPRQVALADRNR